MKKQLYQNFRFKLNNKWKEDIKRLKIILTIHHNFIKKLVQIFKLKYTKQKLKKYSLVEKYGIIK